MPPQPDSGILEFAAAEIEIDVPDTQNEPTLSHIGRYALKRPLGTGGLGTVWEAWDPMLSRPVAVKTLQFLVDTPERVSLDTLFLNEARAVAGLNHPHIVTVHDAGLSAHGVYIAMERLRGRDLRQALAHGWRPSPPSAAQLVRRVADALAYAHARGVIHCDIKPANIFLSSKGKPTVLDFGIARVAHGAAVSALDGMVAGSPHYLAPEQLTGGVIDERVDVYSLGVVLYEMLAGRKAFDGTSLEQITNAVLLLHPAPAHEVQPHVPQGLSDIAARAMKRDPAERFASARELATALREWIKTQGEVAGSSARQRAPARTWAPWAIAATLSLAAVIGWQSIDGTEPAPSSATAAQLLPAPPVAAQAAPAPAGATEASATALNEAAAASAVAAGEADPAASTPPAAVATAVRPNRSARPSVAKAVPKPPPVLMGVVQLAVTPWGQIEVDGRPVGLTPPLSRLELSEGTHQVTIRNGDNPAYTVPIQVKADKPVVVRYRFGS